jgi:hypothetical protein
VRAYFGGFWYCSFSQSVLGDSDIRPREHSPSGGSTASGVEVQVGVEQDQVLSSLLTQVPGIVLTGLLCSDSGL